MKRSDGQVPTRCAGRVRQAAGCGRLGRRCPGPDSSRETLAAHPPGRPRSRAAASAGSPPGRRASVNVSGAPDCSARCAAGRPNPNQRVGNPLIRHPWRRPPAVPDRPAHHPSRPVPGIPDRSARLSSRALHRAFSAGPGWAVATARAFARGVAGNTACLAPVLWGERQGPWERFTHVTYCVRGVAQGTGYDAEDRGNVLMCLADRPVRERRDV